MPFTPFVPTVGNASVPLTVVQGGTGATSAAAALAALGALRVVAATAAAGFALQNATPTILTWTTPNDGQMHPMLVFSTQVVTVLETGGQVSQTYTNMGGGGGGDTLYAGGSAAGTQIFVLSRLLAPNTTYTLAQSTALTAGAATVWAQIWGA